MAKKDDDVMQTIRQDFADPTDGLAMEGGRFTDFVGQLGPMSSRPTAANAQNAQGDPGSGPGPSASGTAQQQQQGGQQAESGKSKKSKFCLLL